MNKTGKIIVGIIIIIIVVWLGYSLSNKEPVSTEPIKIGAILPLSGGNAVFGEWIRNGIQLALKDAGAGNIQVIYEDSQFDAKQGVSAFNKLVNLDKADIIVSAMSSVSVPLVPLAKEKNKILMLQDVTYPDITKDNPLVFRHFIQSDREAETLSSYAFSDLRVRKVGILYINDESGVGARDSFIRIFEGKGGEISDIESFTGKDTDMRTQILKIKSTKPGAIYLFGNGPSWSRALVQIKESGFDGKVLTNTIMFVKNFRNAAGNAAEGVYFTHPYSDENVSNVKDFLIKYENEYGFTAPMQSYYAWDYTHVLVNALKDNNWKVDGLEKSILEIKEFDGLFGKTLINKDGDFLTAIGVSVMENGDIKILKIINP